MFRLELNESEVSKLKAILNRIELFGLKIDDEMVRKLKIEVDDYYHQVLDDSRTEETLP